jgi:hypothetical protein
MANLTSMLGLLQHIKGKPYDYGLLTYMVAQTLLFTGLSVAKTWTGQPPTPSNQTSVHFGSQALIADSLWSHPAHLDRFRQHGIRYPVAVKENNTLLPAGLFSLAMEDLPAYRARTYTNGSLVLQVHNGDNSVTGVLSNMWTVRGVNQPDHISTSSQICKYKTAEYLFRHESIPFLQRTERNQKHISSFSELATGNVMRPQDQQTGTEPLTREEASKMSKVALLLIHQPAFKLRRPAKSMTL